MSLTVSNDILCELGRIVVLQSQIEGQMALFIQELLGLDDPRGQIITVRLSFRLLVETLGSLLRNEPGVRHEHVKRFDELQKELYRLEDRRNVLAHSMWGFGSDFKPDSATRVKVVKGGKSGSARREVAQVKLDELKELAEAMDQAEWAVSDLRVRVCHYEARGDKSGAE